MTDFANEDARLDLIEAMALLNEASTALRNQERVQLEAGVTTHSPAGELAGRIESFLAPHTNSLFEEKYQRRPFIERLLSVFLQRSSE